MVALPPRSGVSDFALGRNRFDALQHQLTRILIAQVIEHHGRRPDGGDGVGDPLPGDVGRGAVHRLKERGIAPLRVDVAAGRDAQAALQRASQVGEDIPKQV